MTVVEGTGKFVVERVSADKKISGLLNRTVITTGKDADRYE